MKNLIIAAAIAVPTISHADLSSLECAALVDIQEQAEQPFSEKAEAFGEKLSDLLLVVEDLLEIDPPEGANVEATQKHLESLLDDTIDSASDIARPMRHDSLQALRLIIESNCAE